MPRTTPDAGAGRTDLYEITDKIIAELEAGRVPWVQPWAAARVPLDMPHNASTRSRYPGINIVILWDAVISRGFSTNAFLTFRQALAIGGNIRQNKRGTTIVYAKPFTLAEEKRRTAAEGREAARVPRVFPPTSAFRPHRFPHGLIPPAAEALIRATRADFRIGGDNRFDHRRVTQFHSASGFGMRSRTPRRPKCGRVAGTLRLRANGQLCSMGPWPRAQNDHDPRANRRSCIEASRFSRSRESARNSRSSFGRGFSK